MIWKDSKWVSVCLITLLKSFGVIWDHLESFESWGDKIICTTKHVTLLKFESSFFGQSVLQTSDTVQLIDFFLTLKTNHFIWLISLLNLRKKPIKSLQTKHSFFLTLKVKGSSWYKKTIDVSIKQFFFLFWRIIPKTFLTLIWTMTHDTSTKLRYFQINVRSETTCSVLILNI